MLLERCSHSASYTCGFECRFFNQSLRTWAVSKSEDAGRPSWKVGPSSTGAGSKRPREELAVESSSKRRESGRLKFFTPLIVADVRPVSEASTQASKVSELEDSQFLDTGNRDHVSGEDDLTGSGRKSSLKALGPLIRASSHRHLSRSDRRKKRSRVETWKPRRLPPKSNLESTVRSPSPGLTASPAAGQYRHVAIAAPVVPALPKKRTETMTVQERKRCFIDTPTLPMITAMKNWVTGTYALLDTHRRKHDCWLHPSPPAPRSNGRAAGVIHRGFFWADGSGRHCISVNFGIVALIVNHYLTNEQKEGYITQRWHLSHLCGNWTCCNWIHFTVEAGHINISRNICFMIPGRCSHSPKCMKDKKKRLLPAAPKRSMDKVLEDVKTPSGATGNLDSDV